MSEFYTVLESFAGSLAFSLLQIGFSTLLSLAVYVLTAISLYTIARRRGLHNPWLAWVPVANVWLVGSLSDQYRYVALGQNKAKRKWLLALKIAVSILAVIVAVQAVSIIIQVVDVVNYYDYDAMLSAVLGSVLRMLALLVIALAVKIGYAVVRYMALYDIYKSLDPANSVLYLVLSILFSITEPFFLIFNRNKDGGMPPRKPEPTLCDPEILP